MGCWNSWARRAGHGRTALDEPVLAMLDAGGTPQDLQAQARQWHDALAASVRRVAQSLDRLQRLGGPVAEVRISGGWAAQEPGAARAEGGLLPQPGVPGHRQRPASAAPRCWPAWPRACTRRPARSRHLRWPPQPASAKLTHQDRKDFDERY